jgi:hypothetical protein
MKAHCPNNSQHDRFITVAHVSQTWVVDSEGNFLESVSDDEIDHGPDSGNTWTCEDCGADAVVED